jgi:1-acyl-sn-glycerol-3-phosphate acyltransferase
MTGTPAWTYPPPPGRDAASLARGEFAGRLVRPALHAVFRLLLRIVFHYKVTGRRNIPKGPFVLVANHSGHPDAVALMAAVPLRRVNHTHPLAAQDYFFQKRWLGASLHLLLNALPFDRTAPADQAVADGKVLLADGRCVILFPEGTRSETGEIAPFRRGVGLLVAGTAIPVVPAFISGSRDILPKGSSRPRSGRLAVRIGEPVTYAREQADRDGAARIAADLEARVRGLA